MDTCSEADRGGTSFFLAGRCFDSEEDALGVCLPLPSSSSGLTPNVIFGGEEGKSCLFDRSGKEREEEEEGRKEGRGKFLVMSHVQEKKFHFWMDRKKKNRLSEEKKEEI